jgi:HTH-type transcriptional repressor of puuD
MGIDYGTKFRELRKKYKFSQKDLSTIAEVGQTTISDIESGKKTPNAVTIEKICLAVSITLADFFAEEHPELEPELRRLLDTARKLTPEQRVLFQQLLESLNKNNA